MSGNLRVTNLVYYATKESQRVIKHLPDIWKARDYNQSKALSLDENKTRISVRVKKKNEKSN